MSRYFLTAAARNDLHGIHTYIAKDNPRSARAYVQLLRDKCARLAEMPQMAAPDARYLNLRKFPVGNYLIFYREKANTIEVIRILHAARDVAEELKKVPILSV